MKKPILLIAVLATAALLYFVVDFQYKPAAQNTKTHETDQYSFSYPETFSIVENNEVSQDIVTLQTNDFETDENSTITSGARMYITTTNVPNEFEWNQVAMPAGGVQGETIFSGSELRLGDHIVYKKIAEGRGFADEYSEDQTWLTIALPSENKDVVATFNSASSKKDFAVYEEDINSIIKSFMWK